MVEEHEYWYIIANDYKFSAEYVGDVPFLLFWGRGEF